MQNRIPNKHLVHIYSRPILTCCLLRSNPTRGIIHSVCHSHHPPRTRCLPVPACLPTTSLYFPSVSAWRSPSVPWERRKCFSHGWQTHTIILWVLLGLGRCVVLCCGDDGRGRPDDCTVFTLWRQVTVVRMGRQLCRIMAESGVGYILYLS